MNFFMKRKLYSTLSRFDTANGTQAKKHILDYVKENLKEIGIKINYSYRDKIITIVHDELGRIFEGSSKRKIKIFDERFIPIYKTVLEIIDEAYKDFEDKQRIREEEKNQLISNVMDDWNRKREGVIRKLKS